MHILPSNHLIIPSQREDFAEIVVATADEIAPREETRADQDLMMVADAFPGVPPESIPGMLLAMEDFPSLGRREISRITPENTGYSKIIGFFIYVTISLISLSFFKETISVF